MGANGCQTITNGQLLCHQGMYMDGTTNQINIDSNSTFGLLGGLTEGTCNFCNVLSTGTLNICRNLTTGIINIGTTTGTVNMFSKLLFTANSILSNESYDSINLFTNLTTGRINIGKFIFAANSILSNVSSDTINLFTLTTGRINIGKFIFTANSIISDTPSESDTINLFTNLIGTLNIGRFKFTANSILSNASSDIINLFTNLTTGTLIGRFIFTNQKIQPASPGTVTELFTNQTGDLLIGGSCDITLGSPGPTTTTINGNTLLLGDTYNGVTTLKGKININEDNFYNYNRINIAGGSHTITPPINIDHYFVTDGSFATTVTLPVYIKWQRIVIKNSKGAAVNVNVTVGFPGHQIRGNNGTLVTSVVLSRNESVEFVCDGTLWYQI